MLLQQPCAVVAYLEDDFFIADTMCEVFEDLGCRTVVAADGVAMMRQISNGFVPNVIVTDYFMPGDNGVIMIKRIRAALGIAVPAILLTGFDLKAIKTGPIPPDVSVLTKPAHMRLLSAALNAHGFATTLAAPQKILA